MQLMLTIGLICFVIYLPVCYLVKCIQIVGKERQMLEAWQQGKEYKHLMRHVSILEERKHYKLW